MAPLSLVHAQLRKILEPYAARLDVKHDDATQLYLDTRHRQKNGNPLFFGAVQIRKAYVSYHLMPVYVRPDLLAGISADLKARMHGKSCFNFKVVEPRLFEELAQLTKAGFESYRAQGYLHDDGEAA